MGKLYSKVMIITRPRRFGKTLTMSTFYDFLSLDPENPGDTSRQEKWFKDTEILTNEEYKDFCSKCMGKFPVVFISLKQVYGSEFERAYYQFGCIVFDMYNSFSYLAESPKLNDAEKKLFNEIASDASFIRNIANKNRIKDSLSKLLMFLHKHYGIKPILLIDEYDVPIAKAARNNYYKEMINIIKPFLSNALKTNMDLGRAVLTGKYKQHDNHMVTFTCIRPYIKYNFPNCIAHPSSYSTLFFFGRPLFFFGAF